MTPSRFEPPEGTYAKEGHRIADAQDDQDVGGALEPGDDEEALIESEYGDLDGADDKRAKKLTHVQLLSRSSITS